MVPCILLYCNIYSHLDHLKVASHPQFFKSQQDLCRCREFKKPANILPTICRTLIMGFKIFHLDISWHMLSGSTCIFFFFCKCNNNKTGPNTCKVITSKTSKLDSTVRSCFLSNQPLTVWALHASEIMFGKANWVLAWENVAGKKAL